MIKHQLHLTMIDDDKNFLQALSFSLEDCFKISAFNEPKEALDFIKCNRPDGVLLDLHLKETDGFSICRAIKGIDTQIPVFFLTSDQEIKSIEEGFETGGIDYFTKNISMPELKARVQKRLQKTMCPILKFGEITMNLAAQRVTINKKEIVFTPKEYELLKVFMNRPNEILNKNELLTILWKDVHVDSNNIDTHMFHIRKKLKDSTTQIETRKTLGYILTTRSKM